MSFLHTQDARQKIEIRLNRIEGQLRGIHKMINEEKPCMDILNQISSVQAALKGLWKEVVHGHLQNCMRDALQSGKNAEKLIHELMEHLDKLK